MKYRPKIGVGDFDTKTRQVHKFLAEGHKVKVTIMFRGREIFHPELGQEILERVIEGVKEVGRVETFPKLDGRNMLMVLVPDKRPVTKAQGSAPGESVVEGTGRPSSSGGPSTNGAAQPSVNGSTANNGSASTGTAPAEATEPGQTGSPVEEVPSASVSEAPAPEGAAR
jgi:translation initiation factor IF-3